MSWCPDKHYTEVCLKHIKSSKVGEVNSEGFANIFDNTNILLYRILKNLTWNLGLHVTIFYEHLVGQLVY